MKKLHYLFFALIMGLSVSMTSCSSDDNDSPIDPDPIDPTSELPVVNKTVAELRALTTGDAVVVPADFVVKGIVVSNQAESNNFYQAIYVQDGGVAVKISCLKEDAKLYETYVAGQEVYLKAAGFYIAKYYDTYTLGFEATDDKYKVSRIPETNLQTLIVAGDLDKAITPVEVSDISTLSPEMVGTLVKVTGVQVIEDDKGKTLGTDDQGYTEIKFINADNQTISISNNNYAEFSAEVVPEGSGSISGILNTFGSDFQIALTSVDDLDLAGARFETATVEFVDKTVDALEETFSTATVDARVDAEGWFTEAVTGTKFWEAKEYSSTKYIQAAGYNSGQDAMETWIVSPGLNLDATDSKKNFSFDSKRGYTKAEVLKVLVSTDFDYNTGVAAATWEEVTVTLPAENGSGYTDWVNSGVIDLSGKSGVVYVAFKYEGNQTDATGTWQIGNVKFNFTPEEPVDVAPSYNFEEWTDGLPNGWTFVKNSGSTVTKVTDKKEGEYAMRVGLDSREDFNIIFDTENNNTYKVSFWYKMEGTPGSNGIKLWSKVGDEYADATLKDKKLDVQTDWTLYEATFDSEVTDSFKFEVRGYNADGLVLYMDDVKVVKQ